jgi:hypothetical protein
MWVRWYVTDKYNQISCDISNGTYTATKTWGMPRGLMGTYAFLEFTWEEAIGKLTFKDLLTGTIIGTDTDDNLIGFVPEGGTTRFYSGYTEAIAFTDYQKDGVLQYEYKLGNIADGIILDSSGNNNTGTVSNVTVTNDVDNTYAGSHPLGDNEFWSTDGIVFDALTSADFITHTNWVDQVIVSATGVSAINDVFTWEQDYQWTTNAYTGMLTYLTAAGAVSATNAPLTDVSGEYITDTNNYLIFPTP